MTKLANERFAIAKAKDTKPLPKAKVKPTGKLGGGGNKTLAGVLDFLRIIPSGANTFDAGTVSIRGSA